MRTRRAFIILGGLGLAGAAAYQFGLRPMLYGKEAEVGFTLTEDELAAARAFMAAHPIVDSHAHPGRTFLKGAENLSSKIWLYKNLGGTFEDSTLADMKAGGVDAAAFNGVADIQLLTLGKTGLTAQREFQPGEAWKSFQRQIANLRALADSGKVRICLNSADVLAAKKASERGMILAMEGADFIERDLMRVDDLAANGVRMVTLVHYHNSTIGDIMTGPVGNRGLTDFGRKLIPALNKAGITIDLSHASEKTARDVLDITTRPVVLTHTHIKTPQLDNPRFVSADLARAVAETGGYIGAWPAGIGITSLAQFIDRIDFLVQTVGEDAVAMGSDMDANYKPVLETYRKMPLVVGALMKRGYSTQTLAKIMGGNVLRVLDSA